ncbi:MAG: hypothetical protein AB1450_13385 [Pseudomonadota bacterium]
MKHTIETYTGLTVDLANPDPRTISADDIAHALSRIQRFGGHTNVPYSVAQHSVLVAEIAHRLYPSPDGLLERQALLHDAQEAYLGDMVHPLKTIPSVANAWNWLEAQMARVIHLALGVQRPDQAATQRVHHCDRLALAIEARELKVSRGEGWDLPAIPAALNGIRLEPLDHHEAKRQWWCAWGMTSAMRPAPIAAEA